VGYDQWFIGEVEKGLAQIERGEVLTHKEVGARAERLLTEKQSRA
jgi:predicted transcriptional regulator